MRIELQFDSGRVPLELRDADHRVLSDVMRQENLPLNTRCGQHGVCKACVVDVQAEDGSWESVRSCQWTVRDGATVRIPESARLTYRAKVLDDYALEVPYAHAPVFGAKGLGLAMDIGTTTVSVGLFDLETGDKVGKASAYNRQMHYGDDVLTRINLCRTDPGMVRTLQRSIVWDTLVPLIEQALAGAGRSAEELRGTVLSANTTMLHLALGVDPSEIGVHPFTPKFLGVQHRSHGELGLPGPMDAEVLTLPGIAGYVGADIVSGAVASGFVYSDRPTLFVDIGTNGEMVLKVGDRLVACATAAGPAFEGSGLSCGVRAGDGAISHLTISRELGIQIKQIGEPSEKPIGICGSAYIDFLAQGYACGLLSATGRFDRAFPNVTFVETEYGPACQLALGQGKRPITISEPDVASLLQAKAAIAAGVQIMTSVCGLTPEEVDQVVLAGGFGMHLNLESAVDCGLLPGFQVYQVKLVGNSSLGGAHLALLDRSAIEEMERAAQGVEIIELNLQPEFEDTYLDQLMLGVIA